MKTMNPSDIGQPQRLPDCRPAPHRRWWSVLLWILAILGGPLKAAEQEGDFTYVVSVQGPVIIGYTGPGGAVAIPPVIAGSPVLVFGAFGFDVFDPNTPVTSVSVPASVTSIASYAFDKCPHLTAIHVDAGNANFSSSSGVLFNKAATSLLVFPQAKSGSYSIPIGVTNAAGIRDCRNLTELNIPASVTNVGGLPGCTSLLTITADAANPVYTASGGVLFNKDSTALLRYPPAIPGPYVISPGVTTIASSAFGDCGLLSDVTIPPGITNIGSSAFSGCTNLASVTIPDGVAAVQSQTFRNCVNLTHATLPSTVADIATDAFNGCGELTAIDVHPANPTYSSLDGVLFNKTLTDLIEYPEGKSGPYAVPASLTQIQSGDFEDCAKLTNLSCHADVTSMGSSAFRGCSSLTAIDVDAANPTFSSASGVVFNKTLTELWIFPPGRSGPYAVPAGVTAIGDGSFDQCLGLTALAIPTGVITIGSSAFYDCSNLASVNLPQGLTMIGSGAFLRCTALGSVTIPGSVTSINSAAFFGCSGLTNLVIEEGVTNIEYSAFGNCTGLVSVTIPSTVTNLGPSVFTGCTGLQRVTISDGLESIGNGAFSGCSGLTWIALPSSILNVGGAAFNNCTGLVNATFLGDAPTLGYGVFQNNSPDFSVYFLEGASAFTTPTWQGYPSTALAADALRPVVQSIVRNPGGAITLSWPAPPGVTNPAALSDSIQRSATLAGWTSVPNPPLTIANGLVHYTDPAPPPGSGFYRVGRFLP